MSPGAVSAALRSALAGRRDHAQFVGLNTRRGITNPRMFVLEWHDTKTHERGRLARFGLADDFMPVVTAALDTIAAWRATT